MYGPKSRNNVAKLITADAPEHLYRSVDDVAKRLKPEGPVQCIFPASIRAQAEKFTGEFPGKVLYAVKCNPGVDFLRHMFAAGVPLGRSKADAFNPQLSACVISAMTC